MTTNTERATVTDKATGKTAGFAELATVTHEGRSYTAQGAFVTDTHLTAYCGTHNTITTWDGQIIGYYVVRSSWPVNSFIGTRMMSVFIALTTGGTFIGRTFGEGMIVNAKRTKRSYIREHFSTINRAANESR